LTDDYAMSESGSVTWPSSTNPTWDFTWGLSDAPDEDGLTIYQAYYQGKKVFWKASLPAFRTYYYPSGGPKYKDPLNATTAETHSRVPGTDKVGVETVSDGRKNGVSLSSFFRIGQYRIHQEWTMWDDGIIEPRVYSAGLQHPEDHRHHAYWRLDFDIEGAANETVFEYNRGSGNQGWGPGWSHFTTETQRTQSSTRNRCWAIMDEGGTGPGYLIIPGHHDGPATSFAPYDLWGMRFHWAEDENGRHGQNSALTGSGVSTGSVSGVSQYIDGENIRREDDVIWYCSHFHHNHEDGRDEWLHGGPVLVPFRYGA
jgi:hypothetical protein